jgi:hypothetical protein
MANILAEVLYTQIDDKGSRFLLLKYIIEHENKRLEDMLSMD